MLNRMRNHELVPIELINNIARLKYGGIHKVLSTLLRYKLVAHASNEYNGYRLSYLGYDILALHALLARGIIVSVGNQIGVGKESDIFEAQDSEGNEVVIKLHRLGRTSFRAVRKSRDYLNGKSKASWLFMSRLAAVKEFAFMKALHAHGFPVPTPIDQNRHIVAMSRVNGCLFSQLRAGSLNNPDSIYQECTEILIRLAEHGLVHCDFNEFNLMIDPLVLGPVTLIDFPQMVSCNHPNAEELFQRDLSGLRKFFATKMRCSAATLDQDDTAQSEQEESGKEYQLQSSEHTSGELGRDLPPSITLASIRKGACNQPGKSSDEITDLAKEALSACELTAEDQMALEEFLLFKEEGVEEENCKKEESEAIENVGEVAERSTFSFVSGLSTSNENEATIEDQGEESLNDEAQVARNGEFFQGKSRRRQTLGSKTSRNMTKKINKYGRIIRSDRLDPSV